MGVSVAPEVMCTFLDAEGEEHSAALSHVDPVAVVRGRPVRAFPSHATLRHYPGWWWSATMGDLVGYESLLERDCLVVADQDPEVVGIASQPLWLQGTLVDGQPVRHVPDYLLARRDGGWTLVDVKPQRLVDEPAVGKVLSWTGQVAARRGWAYEVWTGDNPVRLGNLHFLAQGRRPHLVDPVILARFPTIARTGMRLATLQEQIQTTGGWAASAVRSAMITALWSDSVSIDLDQPLTNNSLVTRVRSAA